jgi:polygalacturonase
MTINENPIYAAAGDGITDDRAAISAAIAIQGQQRIIVPSPQHSDIGTLSTLRTTLIWEAVA